MGWKVTGTRCNSQGVYKLARTQPLYKREQKNCIMVLDIHNKRGQCNILPSVAVCSIRSTLLDKLTFYQTIFGCIFFSFALPMMF